MRLIHKDKGIITQNGKKYNPLTNRMEDIFVDESGKRHKLDGTEMEISKHLAKMDEFSKKERISMEKGKEKEKSDRMEMAKERLEESEKAKKHQELLNALSKLDDLKDAIKSLPTPPKEIKVSNSQEQTKALQNAILKATNDITEQIGLIDTEIDLKPLEKKLDEIKKVIPGEVKIPKPIDYSKDLKKIADKITDNKDVVKAIKEIPQSEFPDLKFTREGRLKVEVDRISTASGGGTNLALDPNGKAAYLNVDADGNLKVNVDSDFEVPSTVLDGTKTSTGTAVALGASTSCQEITITALHANTSYILVGNATSQNNYLYPGDSRVIKIDNLSKIYIKANVSGEGVTYFGS